MSPAAAVGAAWMAWALWVVASRRSRPGAPAAERHPGDPTGGAPEEGRRRLARRTLAVGAVAFVVYPPAALVVAAWWARRLVVARRRVVARDAARCAAVPEVADLFVAALSSGLTVRHALLGVADVTPGPLADDLRVAARSLRRGDSLVRVLSVWSGADHPLAPVGAALGAADRSGAAATPVLSRCADQQRELARRAAEAQVRRLPVRLLGPLVLCVLPALIVATFGPLAVVSLQQLGSVAP